MTSSDDDTSAMGDDVRAAQPGDRPDLVTELLSDEVIVAGLEGNGADLADLLRTLRTWGEGEPLPVPAHLLDPVGAAVARLPLRRLAVGLAAACILAIAVTITAAAHHALPAPAERFVSDVVNHLSPFSIAPGRPAHHPPGGGTSTGPGRNTSPSASRGGDGGSPSTTGSPGRPGVGSSSHGGTGDDGTGDDGTGDDGGSTSNGATASPTPSAARSTHGDDGGGDDRGRTPTATPTPTPSGSPSASRSRGDDGGGGGDS